MKKIIYIIIGFIALGLFARFTQSSTKDEEKQASAKVETETKTYSERFEEKNFDELRGGYKPIKRYLKENINDPSSLEIVNTWNNGMNKDSTFAIKTTFRAKNAYNALVLQAIYCNLDYDGNLTNISIE
ncbi:hypothetical protein [Flavobacterium fluviatile]|uniref:hypothetical protein n=1 Tax=Flavobacterium fluviatile TaxID=1862387 RepID=UPI0013D6A004|nr:hypothetical protein [Flavobacterium fluviatile]